MFETLTEDQLVTATGAAAAGKTPIVTDPKVCTPANPSGARIYNQSMERDHSGPSLNERANAAVDKAMAPWELFNGIFGGMAADAPRISRPAPQRPGIE